MTEMSIAAIAKRLETQDNAGTKWPVFLVQQRERIYGVEQDWADGIAWVDGEGVEVATNDPDFAAWSSTETGYVDQWVFVQPFFTREAAQLYIGENAHNLTDPRIYVDSVHRNKEWQAVVRYLKAHSGGCVPVPGSRLPQAEEAPIAVCSAEDAAREQWRAVGAQREWSPPTCHFARPGRGDCENAVGLPGKSISGQHDGEDDTVDVYGKPNGWCWHCWLMHQREQLRGEVEQLKKENAALRNGRARRTAGRPEER